MVTLLISTYIGYFSAKHVCHDYDCKLVTRFKNQKCEIAFDGNHAKFFGGFYPMKHYMSGYTQGYDFTNSDRELTIFFRPPEKILRVYYSEYFGKNDYYRWTCEFGRENEKVWK